MSDDEKAYEYYVSEQNQRPGARVTPRVQRGRMTAHVPVRFPAEAIARVKAIAEHDGLTVSTWIRQVVMHEVERRIPPESKGRRVEVSWTSYEEPAVTTGVGTRTELALVS